MRVNWVYEEDKVACVCGKWGSGCYLVSNRFGETLIPRSHDLSHTVPGCIIIIIIIIIIKRYNLYKVLACSTTFFHLSLFCATFFQSHTVMLFISSKTSSSQRVLGLPIGLLNMGFHIFIFLTLSSAMHSTWANQLNLGCIIRPVKTHNHSINKGFTFSCWKSAVCTRMSTDTQKSTWRRTERDKSVITHASIRDNHRRGY